MAQDARRVMEPLLFNPRIGLSWVIFLAVAFVAAMVLIQTNQPPQVPQPPVRPAPSAPVKVERRSRRHARPRPAAPVTTPQPVPQPEWHPRTTGDIVIGAMAAGYVGWALSWGLPAAAWLAYAVVHRSLTTWSLGIAQVFGYTTIGCLPVIVISLLYLAVSLAYAVYGGGIFHFARYWWRVCHPPSGREIRPTVTP